MSGAEMPIREIARRLSAAIPTVLDAYETLEPAVREYETLAAAFGELTRGTTSEEFDGLWKEVAGEELGDVMMAIENLIAHALDEERWRVTLTAEQVAEIRARHQAVAR